MANPTTNYGFVLPTPTDLVTDLPADFDVALQGVDTRLKALQPGTTLGDIAYSSATANTNTRLAIGSTGNVLTVAAGVPSWAAPAAGGGWTSIASGSLSTGTLSLTSISSSYKNLQLVVRNMQSSANANVQIRINNVSTGNYERIGLSNNISTVTTFANGNATEWITTGATTMKGTSFPASLVVDFPDYTNTTSNKMMQMTSVYEQSTSGEDNTLWAVGSLAVGSGAGLNAISRIDMILSTGTYTAGTYILYGGN
jgi:hypothetical protein